MLYCEKLLVIAISCCQLLEVVVNRCQKLLLLFEVVVANHYTLGLKMLYCQNLPSAIIKVLEVAVGSCWYNTLEVVRKKLEVVVSCCYTVRSWQQLLDVLEVAGSCQSC